MYYNYLFFKFSVILCKIEVNEILYKVYNNNRLIMYIDV